MEREEGEEGEGRRESKVLYRQYSEGPAASVLATLHLASPNSRKPLPPRKPFHINCHVSRMASSFSGSNFGQIHSAV